MKKQLLLFSATVILVSMSCLTGKAQESMHAQFGVKGGLNLSNLYTSESSGSDLLVGFNLGFFDKLPLTETIAIQPEFYLTTKGSSVTYNGLLLDGTAKFNLTYLEVPVLVVVNLTPVLNVQFGPYLAYLVDGKVTNVANVSLFNFEQNMNVDDYNRFDAGVAVGAGIDLGSLTIGARYNYGLTKVGKTRTILGSSYTIPNANNGVINFYVALGFNK